jgi:diaminopimelate decarboxylase
MILEEHHLRYQSNQLFMEQVSLSDLAQEHGTPLAVYSAQSIRNQIQALQVALSDLRHEICFAVKANSNLSLLKLIFSEGVGADLVSGGELERCIRVGLPGRKMVFSGVGKQRWEIEKAIQAGIHSFNVESLFELEHIEETAGRLGKKVKVAFRFNPHVNAKTHPYISTGLRDNKFGLLKTEAITLLKRSQTMKYVAVHGISVHIGSQILSLSPIREAFTSTLKMIHTTEKILQRKLEWVDVGGGLGIPYRETEKRVSLQKYGNLIKKYFSQYLVMLEPGRFIVGNSGALVTQVIGRKVGHKKEYLIVDGAMNDLMRPSLYQAHHEIIPLKTSRGTLVPSDVVGPICETGDFFASKRKLPRSLNEGDCLAILSFGAYGTSMSSQYNSRPRIAEVLVEGDRSRLIKPRETWSDLFSHEEGMLK